MKGGSGPLEWLQGIFAGVWLLWDIVFDDGNGPSFASLVNAVAFNVVAPVFICIFIFG